MRAVTLENFLRAWGFGSKKYVDVDVTNMEEYFQKKWEKIVSKAPTPCDSYQMDIILILTLAPIWMVPMIITTNQYLGFWVELMNLEDNIFVLMFTRCHIICL